MTEAPSFDADIIVVGGGLVGLAFARAVSQAGLPVIVLDAAPVPVSLDEAFDGRVSALGRSSCRLMQAIGAWSQMAPHAQPILDIQVSDGRLNTGPSPLGLHFDHREAGEGPMGYIVENRHIRQALHAAPGSVDIRAPANVSGATPDAFGITVKLADGTRVRGRVCVAADGRNSPLRLAAGIKSVEWDYGQSGIVATVSHALPHQGVAHEYFLPGGPFAMLPMTENRCSLVWTEATPRAKAIMALDQAAFEAEMRLRFGEQLGATNCKGRRWIYPLGFHHAHTYLAGRMALAGDAAHTIHPIAGQGLNLGLRDAAALAEVLVEAHRLGLDIGAATVLERYQQWRRFDNVALAVVTDGLNRLFSNDSAPLRLIRDLGMEIVGRIGPVRRFLMRHAAGEVGELPRLLGGLPL